jgi:DNA invertase Pin-like site-specific DNA recombinase
MKIALYLRVSTLEQNCEAQRRELQAYAARHGWDVIDQYEDTASGADPKRPELARLLADARAGKFETVLVWKLDRFGRSLLDCLHNLELLEAELVRFIAVSQGIDTDRKNPAAKLLLHIMAAFAECEREMIRERVKSGVRRYQQDFAAGKVGKSVHSQSGKDLPSGRPWRIVDVEKIASLRTKGLTFEQIGKQLGISAPTACRRLKQARFTSQDAGAEMRD